MFRKRPERIRGIAGSLEGKGVLIADSSSGAGPGIARVAAEAGARVMLATTNAADLDLQLRALTSTAGRVSGSAGPLATPGDLRVLVDGLETPIDMAVVNPSTFSLESDIRSTGSSLDPRNAAELAKLVAAQMRDRGIEGSIVFVTGIIQAGSTAPAIALLEAEMQRLASDCAPNAIRVNGVAPGHVALGRRGKVVPSRVAPLGHVSVHPIEVGKAVWFLLNDDLSSALTGTTLKTDRGASLLRPEW